MTDTTTNAGLWIDHREAIIVTLTQDGEETQHIYSDVERQARRSGAPEHGSVKDHQAPADDIREREFMGHLAHYYDEVISALSGAGSILIFGPGEAKGELEKRFAKHSSGNRTIALETTDKMTEPQIVALVRHHFHRDPARL
jgi:hypothetical protein